jgi:acyl-CoA thioester hydrolase
VPQPFDRDLTVRWADADAAGILWHGHLFRYLEETEEELFCRRGTERQTLLEQLGILMPRTHVEVGFRSPARLNESLRVRMMPEPAGPRRIRFRFQVVRSVGGAIVCEGAYRVACVDATTFAPRDFPAEVIDVLGLCDP